MAVEKIVHMLDHRPPRGKFREQLFWLVDLVYACKSSGSDPLAQQAQWVEDALASLGDYLETGSPDALSRATQRVEQFAQAIAEATAGTKNPNEE